MALTISRRSCCIFAIPNPARWARHADSIGSISDQRASDRSVRYARRGVFTRLLYQSNIHNGGTSAVSSPPRSYQIMPKRDEMPSYTTKYAGFNTFGESTGETVTIPSATEGDVLGTSYVFAH